MSAAAKSAWFDQGTSVPNIAGKAKQLETFVAAMADGRIDDGELKSQEARVVALMKEIEPKLDAALHAKVTDLLCEITAYDLMLTLRSLDEARPKTTFRG